MKKILKLMILVSLGFCPQSSAAFIEASDTIHKGYLKLCGDYSEGSVKVSHSFEENTKVRFKVIFDIPSIERFPGYFSGSRHSELERTMSMIELDEFAQALENSTLIHAQNLSLYIRNKILLH